MKFVHIDESGSEDQGDVFVMAGVMIDAMSFGGWAPKFDRKISDMLDFHKRLGTFNLKAKEFIEGKGGWNQYVDEKARMKFFKDLCTMVTRCGTVYAYGMSFKKFNRAVEKVFQSPNYQSMPEFQKHYWITASMFITCLIQKRMQRESRSEGATVLIFDSSNLLPLLSDCIFKFPTWYGPLYAQVYGKGSRASWQVKAEDRFNRIVNGGYPIRSGDSTLIQVADVLSYIYRRHLELESGESPNYPDEPAYYSELVNILKPKREILGQCPGTRPKGTMTAVEFYRSIKHPKWAL